jgi:ubiquinone/menaquinone biosynthesis C-methylase UbiE
LNKVAKIKPFEHNTTRYEDWFEKNKFAYLSELEAVKKAVPQNGIGLEIGVGSGRFAVPLGIIDGIDPSHNMRAIAQERGVLAVDGVAEDIPFPDASFDYALMVTTICFVDDIAASCKEVYRIVKPNGYIIIGFVDKESPVGKLYQKHKGSSVFYREAVFYSTDEIVSYLRNAGFSDFLFYQTIFKPLHTIKEREPVLEGYGRGSFVVVKGLK